MKVGLVATFGLIGLSSAANAETNPFGSWDRKFATQPPAGRPLPRPLVYGVEKVDPPSLLPRSQRAYDSTARLLARSDAVILSHHAVNETSAKGTPSSVADSTSASASVMDHELQVGIISRMMKQGGYTRTPFSSASEATSAGGWCVGISGLRASQTSTDALATYLMSSPLAMGTSSIDDPALLELANQLAGQWSAEEIIDDSGAASVTASQQIVRAYAPLLAFAKAQSLPLVPLALSDMVISRVATSGGLDAITDEEKAKYFIDARGYASSLSSKGSVRYANRVIPDRMVALNRHESQWRSSTGLQPSGSYQARDVYAAMTLQDEASASLAARERMRAQSPSETKTMSAAGPMIVVTTVNRARFGNGLSNRLKRNLELVRSPDTSSTPVKVTTVLLNPTAADSLTPLVQLQLILGYGPDLDDCDVIADYLWFSSSPSAKLLPRVKNPIDKEGDRPPGESSVIGAFGQREKAKVGEE